MDVSKEAEDRIRKEGMGGRGERRVMMKLGI